MFKIVVFPGQGSQRKSMGLDFARQFPEAQETFNEASETLSLDMQVLVEDEERIQLTEYAQAAILTTEIAMFRTLASNFGLAADFFGGHSLGEYAALVAAGVIPFGEALRLVRLRGQLMQQAAPLGVGGMAAIISEQLPLCELETLSHHHEIDIANDNSPTQLVLSGEKSRLAAVIDSLAHLFQGQEYRAVSLEVSAPFHSRHMAAMEASFRAALESVRHTFDPAHLAKVTSNVTGHFHTPNIDAMIDLLTRQISGRVRWRENMHVLLARASGVVEIGPGRPLGGFFKGLLVSASSIIDLRSAQRAFEPKPAV